MSDILEYCLPRWLEIGLPLDFVDTFLTLANTLDGPTLPLLQLEHFNLRSNAN